MKEIINPKCVLIVSQLRKKELMITSWEPEKQETGKGRESRKDWLYNKSHAEDGKQGVEGWWRFPTWRWEEDGERRQTEGSQSLKLGVPWVHGSKLLGMTAETSHYPSALWNPMTTQRQQVKGWSYFKSHRENANDYYLADYIKHLMKSQINSYSFYWLHRALL